MWWVELGVWAIKGRDDDKVLYNEGEIYNTNGFNDVLPLAITKGVNTKINPFNLSHATNFSTDS